MCYQYKEPKIATIRDRVIQLEQTELFAFNKETPIGTIFSNDIDDFEQAYWKLIPAFVKDLNQFKANTQNARIEEIQNKASFKNILSNRCIIPMAGFYEYQWEDLNDPKCKKILHFTENAESEPLYAAGLYADNLQLGSRYRSYTICTIAANDFMSNIHNKKQRMPVLLNNSDTIERWLRGENHLEIANLPINLKSEIVK